MKKKLLNINVLEKHHNSRLDKFLQLKLNDFSRNRIQNLIYEGCIKINNVKNYYPSKKIKNFDKIEVCFPIDKISKIIPNKIPLNILYDDSDIIIINKSPGVVIHPGAGNYENTIVNGLLFKYKNNLSSVGGKLRPGIVHRIDKDTSGVIVVAKNDKAHINLSKQFSDHTIKRTYEALIWGSLKPQTGKINERISRSIKNRKIMAVRKDKGKNAITNYKTLQIFENINLPRISLIECKLETGRTHQIRVHMKYKGNPILGDNTYGRSKKKYKKINKSVEIEINSFNRQALHAKNLSFIHPTKKTEVFFEAERPKDFNLLIKSLKKASI